MSTPTVSFSEISQDGDLLTIGFSESINIFGTDTSVIAVSNDGQQNNITGANVVGTSLVLNLTNTILSDQTVILNYNGTSTYIADNDGDQIAQVSDRAVTNNSNIIGFVDGNPYIGEFHLMDGGVKMTGSVHGTGTDQIIYSTIAESNTAATAASTTGSAATASTASTAGSAATGNTAAAAASTAGSAATASTASTAGYGGSSSTAGSAATGNTAATAASTAGSAATASTASTAGYGGSSSTAGSAATGNTAATAASTAGTASTASIADAYNYNWWDMDYEAEETADINDLIQVRQGEKGDAVYTNSAQNDYDKKTYILQDNDTSNDPILITESYGGAAYLNDSWMGGSRQVYAVEELSSGGYIIAIKEITDDIFMGGERTSWQTIKTSATGVLDWMDSSYTEDIAGSETLFNEDLNNDGAIGVDTSNLTIKTTDTIGEKIALNDDNSLFIVTIAGDYIPLVEEWSGNSVRLDENQTWDNGSWSREALYVALDNKGTDADTSDDRYVLAVKEKNINSWGGETHTDEHWVVYEVKTDGSFDWMGNWGAEIADYETIFDQDIDGDGNKGVDLNNLESISTDTYGIAEGGVDLKRGSGSLYIVDGNTTLKIKDDYGMNPSLEHSSSWDGGSYSSVGYAVEKKTDGSYALVIKFTETFDDDFFSGTTSGNASTREAMSAYEVHSVSASGVLSWENASFTTSIGSYEPIFKQDIDGDGHVGVDLGTLTDITTDTVNHRLKIDSAGSLYIWDGSDTSSMIAVKDAAGGSPSMKSSFGEVGSDFSYSMDPVAVVKIDDYYRVAIKHTDTFTFADPAVSADTVGTTTTDVNINWEIYKIKADGEIDWSGQVWTESITSWEDEFDLDLNGDGDKSGQISLTNRNTDTTGAILASEGSNGALYIVDGNTQIAINDSWIESSSNWGDGSYSSIAIAASELNNNGTDDTADDYYQVAVKNSNTWTDWQTGQKTTSEDWQIYAIYASGSNAGNNNWEKTVWTQSIQSYETTFQQDLDGDGTTGLNLSNLTTASGDTNGWLLKKDSKNSLYITDSNGENIKVVKDDYGGTPNFDYSSNWGSGSSSSEAVAAEINTDNTFSIAIKRTNNFGSESNTDWEILTVSNSGIIDWSKSVWTQSIQAYEKTFGEDFDNDGSKGLNLGNLSSVDTDTYSDVLKKDSNGNFFILTEAGEHIAITESWGGSAQFDYSSQWEGGSWSSKAVAVEDITYTNFSGSSVNGYVIAIKNSGSYGSDQFTDWELRYTDSKGVIDWNNSIWTQSIKSKESLFGNNAAQADLDGDGVFGLSVAALNSVNTDTAGDLLKKDDGNALYIIDNKDTTDTSDDETIAITDQWGGTPTFDWSDSGGSGDYAWAYSSAAYAVESFVDSGTKKFLLAIKSSDTWAGEQNTFWETYVIKESSSGAGDWALDWGSGTWSKAIGKKESVFGQDIDGDGVTYNANNVTTTAVSTDTSTTANTAVSLTKDAQGGLYITKGSTNILIVDSNDSAVAFDWTDTWAGETRTSSAYAVEGIDNDSDNTIDKYKLAIKHELKNNSSNSVTNQWQTIEISTAGVVDWSTETFGEGKLHEADINQDLDGDGKIWSSTSEVLTSVSSDTKGALAYLDSSKNLFIASGSGQTKDAVLDFSGGLISFDETYTVGEFTDKREVLAVESATVSSTDYYKVLIKNTTISGSDTTTAYETVNIKQSTMIVDWGTFSYYDDPKKLESTFQIDIDGDGTITTISSSSTTAIATDTTGAQLRQTSDGSLFIKDGDSTLQITSPDGGYVDLNFTDTFTEGSFKSEALAVQKVGDDYKLVVQETATFGSNTDISYLVYKLTSTGLIDWGDVTYRTTAELNESEFGQDITGDGNISNGSTSEASDTFADAITTSNTDAKVLEQFSNTAQSDIYSISNSDSSSSDTKIEMFVKGVDGSAKTDYTMDVSIVQEASAAVLGKVAADTGVSSSNIKALTGVMDFNVTIPDASNYGKIVSLSWVLPDDTRNPVYFKKDPATGEYFDFQFNAETGEGAKWDDSSKTLTVYVRDNGKYDADTTLGKVRDPGMIGDSGDSSDTTAANISGPSGGAGDATSAKSIAENTTTVHTFTANETASWSFNGGADVSKFSIDSSTGALSFLAAPDFENPTDNGLNNEYVVVVRATDNGSNTSDQTVTVTVSDVDDTNPLIQGNTGSAGAGTSTNTVSENQTTVHTFTADETVTWSLNGGADASKFNINSSTGALSFSSAPDFESPSDANSGNDYVVIVKATDSQSNSSNQTVTVSVSNIIEAGESGTTTFSKSINENTTTVHTFTADETVTWSLNGGADVSKFSINSSTGALTFNSAADFENPADSNTDNDYVVVVRSTDGSSNVVDQTTTISILDVDETSAQITGSSGSAGADSSAKSIQENVTGVHGFTANESVTWSLNGGTDASLFEINSSSGTLSFKTAPDYENPTDSDSDNQYVVVVRATDAQNNTSDQTHTVTITDIGEKTNSSDSFYKLSYKKTDNSTITSLFSPSFGTINGALTLNRLSNAPTISNKPSGLSIGQTGIDFELSLGNSAINGKGKTTTDLDPLLDGLTTTGKNIAYFSYTDIGDGSTPTASTLTYDPVKKAGARFYDLNGDGVADTVNLELVDGGYGDKDGVKNGTIVDPSTAGVVDLTPEFSSSATALTVADAIDTTSPAAFNLSVSISSNASTVNQIGYVALNSNESDTLTYDLVKNRGSILLSNVESSDTPNLSSMDLTADISLINTQKLVFFEVVDTTLESLLANNTNLDGFGSNFNILNLSETTINSANASNGGNTIAISLEQGFSGVNDLISSDLGFNPILDFSGFAGLSLEGSVSVAREAQYNSTVGFYKIQNSDGAVSDPITGDLITPGSSDYAAAALNSSNLFSSLGTLSTSNGNTITSSITSFSDAEMIAPYATVHDTGQTYFSFTEANADGISHFREFGNGVIGLEDLNGGGDNDFDDLIFGFDIKLTV